MSFNTASTVKNAILKGSRISQTIGNSTSTISAMGQQQINRKHQRIRAMSVRMGKVNVIVAQGMQKGGHTVNRPNSQ